MSDNTIIFPVNLPEVQFLGKSQQKKDPSQNTGFASGQNRRRRLFGATPVFHEVSWIFTAGQAEAFESFFENDLEGGSNKFLMQIDGVTGKDYQLFQFEEVYTGPDKIAGDAYTVSAKLIQFTFNKEYIKVRLPFTEVESTDNSISVARSVGPDGAPNFDLSVGEINAENVLIARYDITTFAEINNAVNAGKVVLLQINPLPSTRHYALISSAEGAGAFIFSRVTAEKLYTYTCTGQSGWSQTSANLGVEGGGGGTSDVEIARYNVTSYSDIATAHSNGKIVILIYQTGSSSLIATLSRIDNRAIEFRYVNDTGRISTFEVNQFDVWTTSIYTPSSSYTLPTASATVLGGIKVGGGLEIIDGVLQIAGFERNLEYGEEQSVERLELEALEPSLSLFTDEGYIERLELEALEPSLSLFTDEGYIERLELEALEPSLRIF